MLLKTLDNFKANLIQTFATSFCEFYFLELSEQTTVKEMIGIRC